jgi:hypothetical protein
LKPEQQRWKQELKFAEADRGKRLDAETTLTQRKIMKQLGSLKLRLRAGVSLAVVAATVYSASIAFVAGADPEPKAKPEKKTVAKTAAKTEKKKLTGAELYAINCNRCHAERYATEFTSAQWKSLMTHMRVRANLPAAQAKVILKYLQEDSGN